MKRFAVTLGVALFVNALDAKAEPLARLFESSRLWQDAPEVKVKTPIRKKKKSMVRNVASEASPVVPATVQTFIYGDDYSFSKNSAANAPGRDIASVAMKGRVIGVRRELSLTDAAAKGVDQEYLINAGSRLGLSKGTKLKVYRTLPVVDPFNGNKQYELKVDFATVEVVHIEDDVAVAQMVKLKDAKAGPYVGLRGILVGDYVSLR